MALRDSRSFRYQRDLWMAEVHSAIGPVIAGDVEYVGPAQSEVVLCSRITNRDDVFRFWIPGGLLTRLRHQELLRLFANREPSLLKMELFPHNFPDPDEFADVGRRVLDSGGLAWIVQSDYAIPVTGQVMSANMKALRFTCLDDSALKTVVPTTSDLHEISDSVLSATADSIQEHLFCSVPDEWER